MKPLGSDMPQVVVKWYAYAKWVLERVESFPKSQRFILGQRLSNPVMDVLETLVKASYAKDINGVSPRGFTYGLYCYVLWSTQGHGKTYKIPISRGGLPCDGAW